MKFILISKTLWSVLAYFAFSTLILISCLLFLSNLDKIFGILSKPYCEDVAGIVSFKEAVYAGRIVDGGEFVKTYKSDNGGLTWYSIDRTHHLPRHLEIRLYSSPPSLVEPICHPDDYQLCYRIQTLNEVGQEGLKRVTELQESSDGGKAWQKVKLPFEIKPHRDCSNIEPMAMAFVEQKGGAEYNLVVGVKEGGIIVRLPDDEWIHISMVELKNLD